MTVVRFRPSAINLSPWVRAVAGDTAGLRLPHGYTIDGLARTGGGPWNLVLRRPSQGWQAHETAADLVLVDRWIRDAASVGPELRALVDLAAVHEHQQATRTVVTVGPGGWIEDIRDE